MVFVTGVLLAFFLGSRSKPAISVLVRVYMYLQLAAATLKYTSTYPPLASGNPTVPLKKSHVWYCYQLNQSSEYYVYEPLTAATLETIASSQSLETSYVRVTAFHAKDIFIGPPARPTGIQVEKLKVLDQDLSGHVRQRSVGDGRRKG